MTAAGGLRRSVRGLSEAEFRERFGAEDACREAHVGPKHAQSYLTSFAYRFNRRHRLDGIVQRLAWAAIHTVPQPYHLVIADA